MPYSFNGQCYQTIMEAGYAELDSPPISTSAGIWFPNSMISSGPLNLATLQYQYYPVTGTPSMKVVQRLYNTCPIVGPMTTDTMMTPSDASELAWAVVACFVLAYCIKLIRRAL